MVCRLAAPIFLMAGASLLHAQQALPDSLPPDPKPSIEVTGGQSNIPENAWIDLRQTTSEHATTQSAPSWVEAVSMTPTAAADGTPKTIFRIRVAHPLGDYKVLFFRLFFDDKAGARPELTVWD